MCVAVVPEGVKCAKMTRVLRESLTWSSECLGFLAWCILADLDATRSSAVRDMLFMKSSQLARVDLEVGNFLWIAVTLPIVCLLLKGSRYIASNYALPLFCVMESAAGSDSLCRLNPITSSNTYRYLCNPTCVQLRSGVIERGPTSRGSISLGSKWRSFVHPEGQLYHVLSGEFAFTVVTEANMEDPLARGRILDGTTVANTLLYCHDIKIPPGCELFLELGDDQLTCNYYFVDPVGRELFWLEDICTERLNIRQTVSTSHLAMQMRRLYWVHVEYFPMHHDPHEQQFSEMINELYNIISHGLVDRLTSNTSTFPYTSDACRQFLELLSRKGGQPVDGYTLCYAARLAGTIAEQRFTTFYGQKPAQLDRLQEMFSSNVIQHRWLPNAANLLLWGIPLHYTSLMDELYVNEEVYAEQWTRFLSICLTDWISSLSWSPPVLIASLLLANVRGGTMAESIPSVLFCAISIASASCLHLRHHPLQGSRAGAGARYLHFAKSSTTGFLSSSVAFSLPRATYLWGVGFLIAQLLFVASQNMNKFIALLAGSVIVGIMLFVVCVTNPEDADPASLFRTLTSLCIPRVYDVEPSQDEIMV